MSIPNKSYFNTLGPVSYTHLKQAYLMMAQTNSVLLPATDLGAWTGAFTPATFAYAGGLAWGTAPWETVPVGTTPVKATDYLQTTIPAGAASNVIDNILVSAPWYVFENASPNATGIVLEVVCNIRKDNSTLEKESRYFTMYFGEKKTGDSGNQPILNAGPVSYTHLCRRVYILGYQKQCK